MWYISIAILQLLMEFIMLKFEATSVHNLNGKGTAVYQDFYIHGLPGEQYPVKVQAYIRGTKPMPPGIYEMTPDAVVLSYNRDRVEVDFSRLKLSPLK